MGHSENTKPSATATEVSRGKSSCGTSSNSARTMELKEVLEHFSGELTFVVDRVGATIKRIDAVPGSPYWQDRGIDSYFRAFHAQSLEQAGAVLLNPDSPIVDLAMVRYQVGRALLSAIALAYHHNLSAGPLLAEAFTRYASSMENRNHAGNPDRSGTS